jgi:hypothetical protein
VGLSTVIPKSAHVFWSRGHAERVWNASKGSSTAAKRPEVTECEDLALDDGEVDFDLLGQRACMGPWTGTNRGNCAWRRATDLAPQCEEPLSAIGTAVGARQGEIRRLPEGCPKWAWFAILRRPNGTREGPQRAPFGPRLV